ncbi:hypothetical protein Q6348_01885 [Isoptericola sp. b441]|uniref:ATPase n=1 Tax=Actinotalea lenta TaxID=3064654 RepID=A0ABT9D9U1_9CELL|nr:MULTISPECIES: hypothetical protein [unclassified Isoptericola]MDO8105943.1 hypothetical protein [Isoptericola sp. b441]MDO8122658.1 hypothetical protein [Isoptericola sp. b490]
MDLTQLDLVAEALERTRLEVMHQGNWDELRPSERALRLEVAMAVLEKSGLFEALTEARERAEDDRAAAVEAARTAVADAARQVAEARFQVEEAEQRATDLEGRLAEAEERLADAEERVAEAERRRALGAEPSQPEPRRRVRTPLLGRTVPRLGDSGRA